MLLPLDLWPMPMSTTLDIFLLGRKLVLVEDICFHVSKHRFRENMLIVFSIVDFPPFGFVLQPVWSIHMFLRELCWIRVRNNFSKHRCLETMQTLFSIVGSPLRVCNEACLVDSYVFKRVMVYSCEKSFFKTSISRNHANIVLHSRFPPSGLY